MTMPDSFTITHYPPAGHEYVEAYKRLWRAVDKLTINDNNRTDHSALYANITGVSQSDLSALRQAVKTLCSRYHYIDSASMQMEFSSLDAALTVFKSMGEYLPEYNNMYCYRPLEMKPYTVIPAKYTSAKRTIYEKQNTSWDDVPILPVHLQEIAKVIKAMKYTLLFATSDGHPQDYYLEKRYTRYENNIDDQEGEHITLNENSSCISIRYNNTLYMEWEEENNQPTKTQKYYTSDIAQYEYDSNNYPPPSNITHLKVFSLCIKRETIRSQEFDNGDIPPEISEEQIETFKWKTVDVGFDEIVFVGEKPSFLATPTDIPSNIEWLNIHHFYEEFIYRGFYIWETDAELGDMLGDDDDSRNGVAATGCFTCIATRGMSQAIREALQEKFGTVDRPLALSTNLGSGLLIGHYLTKVNWQGRTHWHYNCDTGILGHYSGYEEINNSSNSWCFTEVLRPRGIRVLMAWNADESVATPVHGDGYQMTKEPLGNTTWLCIRFADHIRHYYTTNGLVCVDEEGGRQQSPPGDSVQVIDESDNGLPCRRWYYPAGRTSVRKTSEGALTGDSSFEIQTVSGWISESSHMFGVYVTGGTTTFDEGILDGYDPATDTQLDDLVDSSLFNVSSELTVHNVDQYTRNNAVEGYLSTYDFADGGRITSYWPTSSSNVLLQAEYYHSVPSDDPEETIEEKRGVQNGQPTVIQHIVRRLFPWGEEIVREITAPGTTVERVTEYFYGTDQTNAPNDYGKRIGERYYDGRWQRTHYDAYGRVSSVVTPFGHQTYDTPDANCRVTEYDYTPCDATNEVLYSVDTRPRRIVEKIGGVEVSRKYFQYFADSEKEILCTVSGAAYDAVTNRVTTRTWYASGTYKGRAKGALAPDGRKTEYSYAAGTGGNGLVTTEREGYGSGATIQHGTQTVTVQDAHGYTVSRTRTDIASGIVLSQETYTNDNYGRAIRTDYLDGSYSTTTYDCCGPIATRNQDGETVTRTRDAFGRTVSEYRDGLWTRYLYTGEHQTGTSLAYEEVQPMEEFLTTTGYNAAGEVISETDRNGITTTYAEAMDENGRWVKTTTHADGGTVIECYNADGSLYETKGTAVHPVRYEYSVVNGEIVSTAIYVNGNDLTHRESSVQNFAGDEYKQIHADNTFALTEFDAAGRTVARVTPAGRRTAFTYGADGRVASEAVVMETGIDPLETLYAEGYRPRTLSDNTQVSVHYRERRRKQGSTVTLLSTEEESVDGNWSFRIDQGGRITSMQRIRVEETVGNATMLRGKVKTRTVSPDNSAVEITTDYGRTIKEEHFDANGAVMYLALHAFDDFKREVTITEKASAAATAFRTTSLVYNSGSWSFVSSRTNNQENASFMYDNMGREYSSARNGLIWSTTYYLTGEVKDRTCNPTSAPCDYRYTYNYFGAVATLSTCYQEQEYNNGTQEWTGTDSLGETQYFYNTRGFLTEKRYPDGNGTQYAYDADGRVTQRIWERGGTTSYTYDAAGRQTGISYSDNDTADISITYDHLDRPVSITDGSGTHTFTYNADGSLATEGSALISGLTLHYGYDVYGRPTSLEAKSSNTVLHSAVTTYNAQGRVATLNNAAHTWQAGTGLLTQTAAGSVPIFNTYNSSMELTGIDAEETLNIGYTYNSYTHLRTGMSYGVCQWSYQYDYHHYLASATLNNQPVTQLTYDQIGNRITCNNTHYRPNACNQYEDLSYDSDGNMTEYDGWALTWNGENRLIRMVKGTAKLEFAYDYMGRRYEKKVYANDVLTKHQRFIYDGYKLIEIRNALNNDALTHSFVWRKVPQDVPYSMTYGNTTYYYITDANKNVVCLLTL